MDFAQFVHVVLRVRTNAAQVAQAAHSQFILVAHIRVGEVERAREVVLFLRLRLLSLELRLRRDLRPAIRLSTVVLLNLIWQRGLLICQLLLGLLAL